MITQKKEHCNRKYLQNRKKTHTMYAMSAYPIYSVGDEVEFEITHLNGSAVPRWDIYLNDLGGINIYATGTVTEVSSDFISVEYEVEGYIGKGTCAFPYYGNTSYNKWQWARKGFLRKKNRNTRCECGSESVYGYNNPFHAFYCPKHDKDKK